VPLSLWGTAPVLAPTTRAIALAFAAPTNHIILLSLCPPHFNCAQEFLPLMSSKGASTRRSMRQVSVHLNLTLDLGFEEDVRRLAGGNRPSLQQGGGGV
jgi:hypothetical protein